MTELKPCPFCGSDDIVFAGLEDAVYRLCCECGAEGGAYDDEESAIDMWNTRHIPEGYALVPVELLERAAEWFTESQGWNWLEYEDKPLDIDEMLQCVEELKKFKAMIAAAQESEE